MIALVIFLTCVFVAAAAGVMAAWSDVKGLIIPNWHSVAIVASFFAAYGVMVLAGHQDVFHNLYSHLIAGVVIFVITAVMFATRVIGAGDSKLCTAYAFWAGIGGLPALLFYMTVTGGLIGLSAVILKRWKPVKNAAAGGWIARVQAGENKVPYGVAIVCGALACFVKLGYFSSAILSFFPGS